MDECGCRGPVPVKVGRSMRCRECRGRLEGEWWSGLRASMQRIAARTRAGEFNGLPDERWYVAYAEEAA